MSEKTNKAAALRAAVYLRFPNILDDLRETMFQLQSLLRNYATSRNYDITFRALGAIADLTVRYLKLRSGNLVMPNSATAMLGDQAPPSDSFLSEQLETVAALHKSAVKDGDIELSRQIILSLQHIALNGLQIETYIGVPGENSVTGLVTGYLRLSVEEGTMRGLDDITLNGCRALGTIGKAATLRKLYTMNHQIVDALSHFATLGTLQRKTYLTAAAVKAIAELAWVDVHVAMVGSYSIKRAFDAEKRIAIDEVSIPRPGLSGSQEIDTALSPFLGVASETSLVRLELLAAQHHAEADQAKDARRVADAIHIIDEINDQLWLFFSEIGEAAAQTESFALFFINENISSIANAQLNLLMELRERDLFGVDKWRKENFIERLLRSFAWVVSAVHWRIYKALPTPAKTTTSGDFFAPLSQIGIRCVESKLIDPVQGIIENMRSMATMSIEKKPDGGFGPPRLAEYIGRIGIIAQKREQEEIVFTALNALKKFNASYVDRFREHAAGRLVYEIRELDREWRDRQFVMDPNDAYFFARLEPGDVERFANTLERHLLRAE